MSNLVKGRGLSRPENLIHSSEKAYVNKLAKGASQPISWTRFNYLTVFIRVFIYQCSYFVIFQTTSFSRRLPRTKDSKSARLTIKNICVHELTEKLSSRWVHSSFTNTLNHLSHYQSVSPQHKYVTISCIRQNTQNLTSIPTSQHHLRISLEKSVATNIKKIISSPYHIHINNYSCTYDLCTTHSLTLCTLYSPRRNLPIRKRKWHPRYHLRMAVEHIHRYVALSSHPSLSSIPCTPLLNLKPNFQIKSMHEWPFHNFVLDGELTTQWIGSLNATDCCIDH